MKGAPMRLSLKEAKKLIRSGNARVSPQSKSDYQKLCETGEPKESKAPKYGNRKTVVDGITFDSQWESEVYMILKDMKRCGEIADFERQVPYVLQDGYEAGRRKILPIIHKVDFKVVLNNGGVELIEAKGFETETYKIKRKMFESRYPNIPYRVVKKGDKI
jgi:hypothetical protein